MKIFRDHVPFLLFVSNFATVCVGLVVRESIDLCRNTTGMIEYEGQSYKTWHFLSTGCIINGNLSFGYQFISDYFWSADYDWRYTLYRLRVTDIPTPLWRYKERFQPRIIQVNNNYAVIMTYDAIYGKPDASPPNIKISYEFESEEIATTTSYLGTTSQELATTIDLTEETFGFQTPSRGKDDRNILPDGDASSSIEARTLSQLVTYKGLAISFGVLFFITLITLLFALHRIRQMRNNQMQGNIATPNGNNQSVTVTRSQTELHETKVNELYSL